jgi:hypothetical protein
MIAISFTVTDGSSGVAYQRCVRRPRIFVLTQSSGAQWHFALCSVPASTAYGSPDSSEFILLITPVQYLC